MKNSDVYIKDEGYADFKLLTAKAKGAAHKLGMPNNLQEVGDTFCGEPVWNAKTKVGVYQTAIDVRHIKRVIKDLRSVVDLVIESEF